MAEQDEPRFEAEVQVGKGMRFIDRNGVVTIDGGRLTLRRSNGEVIAEAPASEVQVEKARFSGGGAAKISIGEERYTIEPLRARRFAPDGLGGSAANLAGDVGRLKKGRELTRIFLAA